MGHIFDALISSKNLLAAIHDILEEDMQEMRTVNLEHIEEEEELDLSELVHLTKKKRKSQYTLEEIQNWKVFDWELEIQLAPEFEDLREKIHLYQQALRHVPRNFYQKEVQKKAREIQEMAWKIIRKKTKQQASFHFLTMDRPLQKGRKVPSLHILAEVIGIHKNVQALVFSLKGILNKKTSLEILPLVEKLLDTTQPFLILDLNELEWIESPAIDTLGEIRNYMESHLGGALALILVDPHFRQKIKEKLPAFHEILFLDRGGSVEYLLNMCSLS